MTVSLDEPDCEEFEVEVCITTFIFLISPGKVVNFQIVQFSLVLRMGMTTFKLFMAQLKQEVILILFKHDIFHYIVSLLRIEIENFMSTFVSKLST